MDIIIVWALVSALALLWLAADELDK